MTHDPTRTLRAPSRRRRAARGSLRVAYTTAFTNFANLKKYYTDDLRGPGIHISRTTKARIEGSPARTLKVTPPFDRFYFVDLNAGKL